MGAQSLVIGKMFGEGFQFGKRKISAMSNEDFNKLTFEDMMSNARDELQASIPTMNKAMQDMKPMVETVVHEFTNYLSLIIGQAPSEADRIVNDLAHALFPHGPEKPPDPGGLEEIIAKLNSFMTLPSAFASDMPTGSASIPLGSSEDTHEKRVALQKIEDARVKKLQAQLDAKINAQIRADARSGKAQTRWKTKKKAGQSQRMEKKKLISQIKNARHNVSIQVNPLMEKRFKDIEKMYFQRLTNLLGRYQF